MQLDYLLKSILARFKSPDYKISIIYHTTGEHAAGYKRIRSKYQDFTNISFIERKPQTFGLKSYFFTFYNLPNIKRFIKQIIFSNKKSDNFKLLLENLLKKTQCEYVMFSTDDGFFFDDVKISPVILDKIKSDPAQTSYRLYVGENLDEFPDYLKRVGNDYYIWDYYKHTSITHWTYPFAVDGTVYHVKSILKIIRKVFYNNPITLESCVVGYVAKNKLLGTGLSPITSKLLCTKLNRVSTDSLNPTINISPDFLNQKFLEGYELDLDLPIKVINSNIVPSKVLLTKTITKEIIYSIDQEGKSVQDSLGIEGTKFS